MKKLKLIVKQIDIRYTFPFFVFAFLLLRFPPLSIVPFLSGLFNTHSIGRYILLFLLILITFIRDKKNSNLNKITQLLLLFYLFTQSLSVINAVNIAAYLQIYKNIVFGILIFYISVNILDSQNKISKFINIFIITAFINLIYQLLIFIRSGALFNFLRNYSYGQYWTVFSTNLERQRYFIDIYDIALVPLLIFYLQKEKNNYYRLLLYLLIVGLTGFSLVSNFRTHIFMLLVAFSGLIFIGIKKRNLLIKPLAILLGTFVLGTVLISQHTNTSTVTRLLSPQKEELATLKTRFYFWDKSVELGKTYPLTGIGLGNFYDYIPALKKSVYSLTGFEQNMIEISYTNPHSIIFGTLGETGFFGLTSFLLLFGYFLFQDISKLKKQIVLNSYLIVSFWTLFSFSLFNPPNTLLYLNLLWVFRALIK